MSGGSSPPSNTTTTTTQELPKEAKPYLKPFMEASTTLANHPYQSYEGQRIAELQPEHGAALNMTAERALQGSDTLNAAQGNIQDTFGGSYLNQGIDMANQANPYMGQANPYSGQNPYLEQAISKTTGDITDNYSKTVNPMFQAMNRGSGAFGNSGIQEMQGDSMQDLAQTLGDVSSGMRMQDYGQQAQLAESGLNRNAMLAGQQQADMLNQFNTERTNQMRGMAFAPQFAETDYRDAQALLGVGDIYRDQSQQGLNFDYDQWQQGQNYPYQQLDVLANALRTSMGGGGTTITSAPNAYASNTTANMIGGGLAGYGAMSGLANDYQNQSGLFGLF